MMKILIVGVGAIGAWVGGNLARSGQRVTLLDRAPVIEVIEAEGLRAQLPDGSAWHEQHFQAVPSLAQAVLSEQPDFRPPYDAVILCVKAYSVREVAADLYRYREAVCKTSGSRTLFVCMQNGVGSEEAVAEVLGAERVVAMTTTSPISVLSPGRIRVDRAGGALALAPMAPLLHPATGEGLFARLCEALQMTGLPYRVYDDYRSLRWSKLLLNMLGNASAAILDMSPSEIYADPRLFRFEMRMLREASAVMRGLGVRAIDLPRFPAALLARAARQLPDALLQPVLRRQLASGRGEKRPSFYYDLARGTGQSEVSFLNGAVERYGWLLDIPTPVNARLTDVLTALTRGVERADDWRGRGDRLMAIGEGAK